jgi:photosynthetic reaction center H subunit
LDNGRAEGGPKQTGWPIPEPKVYKLADGREVLAPDYNRLDSTYSAQPTHSWLGAPLEPVGDPLLAGVGPGAWAARADEPDLYHGNHIKIVPLRIAADHGVMSQDVDPRGLPVYGADKQLAGTVKDLWIDRAEMMFRYLEVSLTGGQTVLLPMTFSRIKSKGVFVGAILAGQFANVPQTKSMEQITLLEEEKITAYYGAGTLYATPERQEPMF